MAGVLARRGATVGRNGNSVETEGVGTTRVRGSRPKVYVGKAAKDWRARGVVGVECIWSSRPKKEASGYAKGIVSE